MAFLFSFSNEYDKTKFEYIYDNYKKLMLHKAYSVLHDYSLAEDAVSESFLRLYKNIHKVDDCESPMAISFLMTIVRNVSITMLNKANRGNTIDLDEYDKADDFNLEEHIISETAGESLLYLIDGLKEDLKAPFLLKYAHDMSHKEIGEILKITENNVTVRIHRAKKKIAELLNKGGCVYDK